MFNEIMAEELKELKERVASIEAKLCQFRERQPAVAGNVEQIVADINEKNGNVLIIRGGDVSEALGELIVRFKDDPDVLPILANSLAATRTKRSLPKDRDPQETLPTKGLNDETIRAIEEQVFGKKS
jgi:hypothetical protein